MKLRGHLINENTFSRKVIGSAFWAGRYFLYNGHRDIFNAEWYFFRKSISSLACKIQFGHGDGNDGIMFHLSIPRIFSIYISFDRIFGKLFRYPNEPRETGISFYDWTIHFYPFSRINSWQSKDNWYSKYYYFSFKDNLFGRWKYTEENSTEWRPIVIPMIEGHYKGKLRLYDGVWKNKFQTKRIRRADLEMEEGIPYPGKGESSWDCGETCSYGLTCAAKTPEEAICSMIEHVLYRRRAYGCYNSMFDYKPTQKYVKTPQKEVDNSVKPDKMV